MWLFFLYILQTSPRSSTTATLSAVFQSHRMLNQTAATSGVDKTFTFRATHFCHCLCVLNLMAALPQYGVSNGSMSASLRRLRKDRESSLCYRLRSIYYDSKFIKRCIEALGATRIPVFANLRNGLWVPERFDGSAYFKSTDGHSHHWNFRSNDST